MRKYLVPAAALALGLAAMSAPTHAQMMGGYGGHGGGYGMGPGMMDGYGGGYGMGPGMMYGYGGHGPGMMYGDGRGDDDDYGQRSQTYRGERLCWHQTGQSRENGYYGACPN